MGFASTGNANTIHTAVSLMYPHKAASMPFDVDLETAAHGGTGAPFEVTLTNPGLYVFFCDIHVYMFAAVIVVDQGKSVFPLDLGKTFDLPSVTTNGIGVGPRSLYPDGLPTASDLALRLVRTFVIYTNPNNWQYYPASGTASWSPVYPKVAVLASSDGIHSDVSLPDLNAFMGPHFGEPKTLAAPVPPTHPGVGQVWVN